jgi:hypothetical protein
LPDLSASIAASVSTSAPGVDQHGALLHPAEGIGIDQVVRLRRQRAVQRHDVGLGIQLVEVGVADAEPLALGVRVRIGREQPAAEAVHDAGEYRPDLARADDADRATAQVEAEQAVEREVALAHPVEGPVRAAVQRQDQRDGVLGDGVRRIRRHAGDGDAQPFGRRQVDMVEAGRAQRDHARPALGQRLQHLGVELIVDEGADGGEAAGERRRLRRQPRLEVHELVFVACVRGLEEGAVVGFGAEERGSHDVWSGCGVGGEGARADRAPYHAQ